MNYKSDKPLFYLLLALLVWLPLPLGSNRPWAIGIMELWIFSLSLYWLLLYSYNMVNFNHLFSSAKIAIGFFMLFVMFVLLQTIDFPLSVINMISPNIRNIYQDSFSALNASAHSASFSLNSYLTQGKLIETCSYFFLFSLILLVVNSQSRLKILFYTLIISGVAQAVYGTIMTLSGLEYGFFVEKEFYTGVATGTFVNRNHFAGYLEMCLALGVGVLISTLHSTLSQTRNEFWRRFVDVFLGNKIRLRIGLAIMVIALVSSHSRMGNAAFFISMSIMGLIYLLLVKKSPRNIVVLFISLFIIDLLIVGNWFGLDKLIDRFEKTQISFVQSDIGLIGTNNSNPNGESDINEPNLTGDVIKLKPFDAKKGDLKLAVLKRAKQKIDKGGIQTKRALQLYEMKIESNTETRDEVYRDTLVMIKDNPIVGAGGGTYANSFLQYRDWDIYKLYDHTHNDYLEFLAEYGLLGTSILAGLVLYSFVNALIAIRKRKSSFMQGVAFASAMGILSLLIHSLSDFNLQIPANAALFVTLLALAHIARFSQFKRRKTI